MKTHHTAVVAIPPAELWEPIQVIRQRYDRHIKEWMPHVTLLYPFLPLESLGEIEPLLRKAAASIAPFGVTLNRFGSFGHGPRSHTLWLAPEPPEPWIDLQEALVETVPECDDTSRYAGGFKPHLSLGQAHSQEQLSEMLQNQSGWKMLKYEVKSIALIVRDTTGVFHVDREFPLATA